MSIEPFEIAEAHSVPTVRQLSVFVDNRVGQLLRLTQLFDGTDARILAVSIVHAVDCAICRMIIDDPDRAVDMLSKHRFAVSESELMVVSLPHGKRALLGVWASLLGAEINIHYTYPMLSQPKGHPAIALMPDNLDTAATVLNECGYTLLDEADLLSERGR